MERRLEMDLIDAEYQFDRSKLCFFFTAENRVDFRDLVKDLASVYKTRIEMRQIGVRDHVQRVDGYGMCGRRLCCSSFMREFEPISSQYAREQNLSSSLNKLL